MLLYHDIVYGVELKADYNLTKSRYSSSQRSSPAQCGVPETLLDYAKAPVNSGLTPSCSARSPDIEGFRLWDK